MKKEVIIIGAGAGGFFTAVNLAKQSKDFNITILEKTNSILSKVKISGGGRCNLTNAISNNFDFCNNYPRGEKELISVFSRFNNIKTMQWFEELGVKLKEEPDGRIFPKSNSSETIVQALYNNAIKNKVNILKNSTVIGLENKKEKWIVQTKEKTYNADIVIITTGSSKKMWSILQNLGHNITPIVPSLFAFNTKDNFIKDLQGITLSNTNVSLLDTDKKPIKLKNREITKNGVCGDMLITHTGFTGPAILKLSAFGARELFDANYKFVLKISWLGHTEKQSKEFIENISSKEKIKNLNFLPKRLWERILEVNNINKDLNFNNLSHKNKLKIADILSGTYLEISSKSTNKQEFVSCGGVNLKEVNFKTMESKLFNNLYFCGEVLDIDALTGGFNLQNAWSGGYIISESILNSSIQTEK